MTRRQKESNPLAADTVRGSRWRTQTLGAALAGAMMLLASTAAAYPVCPAPTGTPPIGTITQCCRIIKPGVYLLEGSVTPTSTGGACFKIMTSGVAFAWDGGLSGNGTGTGIHLLSTAVGDVVYGLGRPIVISGFKTGIVDDAPRSVLYNVVAVYNAVNGIVIRANRVSLIGSNADSNGENGVVVEPRAPAAVVSNVSLSGNVDASGNTEAGLWLDSVRGLSAVSVLTNYNGTDGVDLVGSVGSTIAGRYAYAVGNAGDGIKIVGGHDNVVSNENLGTDGYPNAVGLVVRNSTFDSIGGNAVDYNTGDGMLVVRGKHETIVDGESSHNGGSGIHLKRTTASAVYGVNTNFNGAAGIWLDGSSGNRVDGSNGQSNSTSGVYIGCSSAQEPDGTRCADVGLPASNANRVTRNNLNSSSTSPKPDIGIGIDKGNHHNQVLNNYVLGDTTDDLKDENSNCDSNLWMLNYGSPQTASPASCIPGFVTPPLP